MIDFDILHDRSQSAAEKWEKAAMKEHFGRDDLLPFWVADMEFQASPNILGGLVERAENGIYGYEYRPDSLSDAIIQWYASRHQWVINKSDLCFSRGVMNAITILISQHTEKGDGIIVQPPVFFEFRIAILKNKRKLVRNPLIKNGTSYEMDFEDLEKQAAKPRNKILILCNPHNPVGRVWTKEELQHVGEICFKHNVLVISDEIHADITYKNHQYTPYSKAVGEDISQQSFTCISPAKTFNIASITDAMVVISNQEYRQQYEVFVTQYFLGKPNTFTVAAMESAYRNGGEWLDEFLVYLQNNLDFLKDYLRNNIPKVQLIEPEGSFLVWLDFTELNMDAKDLESFLAQKARIALNSGYWFGRQGAGYARMTIACPQSMLREGLSRLEQAINALPDTGVY
ncbi:MAG: cystathionine beta-lyase [Thiothrix sp.]|nr:MAG: cystathionine beta-lyase [Thiothrix sp.]